MTEAEWEKCEDPQKMLGFLGGSVTSRRKRRLLACACCRLIWSARYFPCWRSVVEVGERFADGMATDAERQAAMATAYIAWSKSPLGKPGGSLPGEYLAMEYASYQDASNANTLKALQYAAFTDPATIPIQAWLVRCLFGNPFREKLVIPPAWLSWQGGIVVKLAEVTYQESHVSEGSLDNGRLAILADALEEAGCTDADILDHLRGPGPHVRGCWPVDLCLGKS